MWGRINSVSWSNFSDHWELTSEASSHILSIFYTTRSAFNVKQSIFEHSRDPHGRIIRQRGKLDSPRARRPRATPQDRDQTRRAVVAPRQSSRCSTVLPLDTQTD